MIELNYIKIRDMNKIWICIYAMLFFTLLSCNEYAIFENDDSDYVVDPEKPDVEEEDNWDGTFDESAMPSATLTQRAMIASYNTIFQDSNIEKIERKGVLISWRWLSSDPEDITFDIYRSVNGGTYEKLNSNPISNSSNYKDLVADVTKTNEYKVCRGGTDEILCSYKFTPEQAKNFYRSIPLNNNGLTEEYLANDAAIGDLDGDGEYEIVLKRLVVNQDNTSSGVQPGSCLLEAYKLDGTFMWRIDLGINIRQGPHYTPFIVYDLDGDGRAEVAFRSSEGTVFGDGTKIGDVNNDGIIDYRNQSSGMVLDGPEFVSVVEGTTGKEMARTEYIPRGEKSTWTAYWGDDWGNRIDRFLMGVGHFGSQDGRASLVICRGYYNHYQVWALHFTDGKLRNRWKFDTSPNYLDWVGQGNHNLSIGDVDNDGKDEIIYGSCTIDHDGTGLYSTKLGHGDALHLGKFDPNLPGLQVVSCHESPSQHGGKGTTFRDAATGSIISWIPGSGDVGRCMVADVDPENPGCEYWSSSSGYLYSCSTGQNLNKKGPSTIGGGISYNMGIWWTGSLNRQALDRAAVSSLSEGRIFTGESNFGVKSINSTKANPCFYGDIWGDWREEMIFVNSANTELRIFTTDFETSYRFRPLMDDHIYRLSAAHQNVGYNQPTHTGYYIGSDLIKE